MPTHPLRIAIIGAGAAGCFAALAAKAENSCAEIVIYEKNKHPLQKVKITGGGRCNLTNSFAKVRHLKQVYPRGHRWMKKLFKQFSPTDTQAWFTQHGVALVTQEDECIFPRSQQSQSVIDALLIPIQRQNIILRTSVDIQAIQRDNNGKWQVYTHVDEAVDSPFDRVIVTVGGKPKAEGLHWLEKLGHEIVPPVPSLFTFNIKLEDLRQLMGTVVEEAEVSIPGTQLNAEGPLLITHWGISGPAVLKLSSHGARYMAEHDYRFPIAIKWLGQKTIAELAAVIDETVAHHPAKHLSTIRLLDLPQRLWQHLLGRASLPFEKRWDELGKKGRNKLIETLTNDSYTVEGRGTFKDEFVTCGGVSLTQVDAHRMESKIAPGLFFAGEVLDIDAITGGFNLQAAWTTGHVAGKHAAQGQDNL